MRLKNDKYFFVNVPFNLLIFYNTFKLRLSEQEIATVFVIKSLI